MAKHKSFTVATNVKVYFCDPQSPWQRGTNENTNGLLRQYFPKKTDLSVYSQAHLNKVALRLNQRPRKTLGFQTPASKLQASVASTVETAGLSGNTELLPNPALLGRNGSYENSLATPRDFAGPSCEQRVDSATDRERPTRPYNATKRCL